MRKTTPYKRPYKWVVCVLLVMASLNFLGFAGQPKNITIQVDGKTQTVSTRAITVGGALEDAGIVLDKADGYDLTSGNKLTDGSTIEVIRAMPVKVWKGGRTTEYTIGRKTVRDVLNAVGVDYDGFQVYPGLDAEVKPGMTIHIISPTNKVVTETKEIPFDRQLRDNDDLPRGRQNVVSAGKNGTAKVTYRTVNVGKIEVKQEINSEVLTAPVPEVVEIGTGKNLINTIETSRGFVRYRSARQVEASAYTLAEGSGSGLTSTGVVPYHGIVAVDPDVIPYGTRMYIPGYGFAVAGDCGGAINGNRIDLYMESYGDAISWGRRNVTMYILE